MFVFGDPQDVATVYYENALSMPGPLLEDLHPDEMTQEQLKVQVVYLRTAAEEAMQDEAGAEVIDILVEWYDTYLQALMDVSPNLRQVVLANRHQYLGGYTKENVAKYKAMASAT